MVEWVTDQEWQEQLLNGGTFLDVRAPVEFSEGALPGAVNIPILNDEERHQVGICYKEHGPQAALELGHKLVSGLTKDERIESWRKLKSTNPNLILYCFRGGQRSGISQGWLREAEIEVPRIAGGYKKIRQHFLKLLEEIPAQLKFVSLGGHTGSGKTRVLRAANQSHLIDLEKLANHRGSAFGPEISPQPSQAQFENQLALELWRTWAFSPDRRLWIEDEARTIGRISLGDAFFNAIRQCPLVLIEVSRAERAQLILEEYVVGAHEKLVALNPNTAWDELEKSLTIPIHKISRKLGGARAQEAFRLISEAMTVSRRTSSFASHLPWIDFLLEHYYDAFYESHMLRQRDRIVYRGTRQECLALIQENEDSFMKVPSNGLMHSSQR